MLLEMYPHRIAWGLGFAEIPVLCHTDHYSLAGEFFPEAAQIAYKMWELSAMTKVQVWAPPAPHFRCACMFGLVVACILITRWPYNDLFLEVPQTFCWCLCHVCSTQ